MTTSAPDAVSVPEGLDLGSLAAFLESRGLPVAGPLTAELVAGGRSNLTFRVGDSVHRWILRRPPLGHVERGAHDVSREFRVMEALSGSPVPVPGVVARCDDPSFLGAPFYLMDEVSGLVLRTREQVAAVSESDRARLGRALVDTLADLHDVDFAAAGLGDLGRPTGYLDRQIDRWERQFRQVTTRGLSASDAIIDQLRRTQPVSTPPAIVHGDFRIDNVMVAHTEPGSICAVLDWEMATLGDPLADLGMLAMFWDEPGKPFNPITGGLTAFPGFGSTDDMVERYSARRRLDVDRIGWYLCFSEFKLAVILEQIHVRHSAGQTLGEGFDGISAMVEQLLDNARSTAGTLGR